MSYCLSADTIVGISIRFSLIEVDRLIHEEDMSSDQIQVEAHSNATHAKSGGPMTLEEYNLFYGCGSSIAAFKMHSANEANYFID